MTELDLKLAQLESGDSPPTGSSTYAHFSTLLQKIAHKQLEVDTQQQYVGLVDEMVTHSTVVSPSAQSSGLVGQLRLASKKEHKALNKMVSNTPCTKMAFYDVLFCSQLSCLN